MVRDSLDVIKEVTELVHPGQAPVVAMDEPLFVIAKNIQWKWPSVYGESKFVIMFGGLHIELAAMKTAGNLLESSGWTGALVQAGVATSGKADSFLKAHTLPEQDEPTRLPLCLAQRIGRGTPRTCEINRAQHRTHESGRLGHSSLQESQPMFKFWFLILHLQLTILVFVRSIRSCNFPLYTQSLTKLVHWFFTFDHYHYARWILVHLCAMMALSHLHPDIHTEFVKGHFTVNKTSYAFSNLAVDQAHEQNNAVVKDDGGAVGLTECPAALQRWTVNGLGMTRVINDFERSVDSALCTSDMRHHDQRIGVQDVMSLKATIDELAIHFSKPVVTFLFST